jgi:hypothetical protein
VPKSEIEQFFKDRPEIKEQLKLPDEAEAAAARVMFIAWLETRGAKNLPTNNQAGAAVCTYCGKTKFWREFRHALIEW